MRATLAFAHGWLMKPLISFIVVASVLALLALAMQGGWHRSGSASAAGSGPEMALDVIAGGTCVSGVCQVGMGSTFTLAVDVVTRPAAGYIGMQTYIDFGVYNPAASEDGAGPNTCSDSIDNGADGADRLDADCVTVDLVYKPAVQASDEIIWPDLYPASAVRVQPGPGLLNLGGLTGIPALLTSTFEGNVTSVQMTCPWSPVQSTINLLPYGDPIALTFGSGFVEPGPTIVVSKVGSLTIDCGALPTPTPLPVDTDGDGCSDARENGPDETLGGLRDPLNPNDFYDVNGDGVIDLLNDVLSVINHYQPTSGGAPPYDVTFDRGPTTGPNPWNMTAPDGVIDLLNDILGVIQQHGHDCR